MITCHANSGQSKIDHFKFIVDLVQAPLDEQGNEIKIKVQSHHSTNNICPKLLKYISHKNTTNREKIQANKKVCSVLQTQHKKVQSFSVRTISVDFLLRATSRQTTQS